MISMKETTLQWGTEGVGTRGTTRARESLRWHAHAMQIHSHTRDPPINGCQGGIWSMAEGRGKDGRPTAQIP